MPWSMDMSHGYEYVPGLYMCQAGQNLVFDSEDIVQTMFFLSPSFQGFFIVI